MVSKLQLSPSSFKFMSGLERDQVDFSTFFQSLLQSLGLRFPCPSTSHDMRDMRSCFTIDFDETSIQHNPFEIPCSISEQFNYVSFDTTAEETNSLGSQDENYVDEVKRLLEDIRQHREIIVEELRERSRAFSSWLGFDVEVKGALSDAFRYVERGQYQRVWKECRKLTTLMPTTVCLSRASACWGMFATTTWETKLFWQGSWQEFTIRQRDNKCKKTMQFLTALTRETFDDEGRHYLNSESFATAWHEPEPPAQRPLPWRPPWRPPSSVGLGRL